MANVQKNSCNQTGTVPENIIEEIRDRLKELEALTLGLFTSLECNVFAKDDDPDDDSNGIKGSDFFIVDKKAVLFTYGNRIWDQFVVIRDYLNKIKKSSDHESDPANLPSKNPDTV